MTATRTQLALATEADTAALGRFLARAAKQGDTFLLSGPIGAGKTHLARSFIQSRLAALGRTEDVPSPTYTLVQVYDVGDHEIWHADLYRLSDPAEIDELGLEDAFGQHVCLVEWPDRLGSAAPADALTIKLESTADGLARTAALSGPARWAPVLDAVSREGSLA